MKFIIDITADNQYMIKPDDSLYEKINNNTPFEQRKSYNIFAARVLGTPYSNYLRWGRDKYNAIIVGKNHRYPHLVFNNRKDCENCVNFLNKRLAVKV